MKTDSREFWWILTLALKSAFHGVLDIGQFHSPQMKPCNLGSYFFIKNNSIYYDKFDQFPKNGGNRCGSMQFLGKFQVHGLNRGNV